ncbi:hypothetical protein Micbo1qcDRAFT_169559, partial [Microdochium bolleyi]
MARLVAWDRAGGSCPVPDYGISLVQLALDLVQGGHFPELQEVDALIHALGLSTMDIAAIESLKTRSASGSVGFHTIMYGISILRIRTDGRLGAASGTLATYQANPTTISETELLVFFNGEKPLEILSSKGLVAWACAGTAAGDLLLTTWNFSAVIRPLAEPSTYRVIGKAVVLDWLKSRKEEPPCTG